MGFNFNEQFAWLESSGELQPGWTNLSLDGVSKLAAELMEYLDSEQLAGVTTCLDVLGELVDSLGLDSDFEVISIKADNEGSGVLERILGPAIFAAIDEDEDLTGELVLKVGQEAFIVDLKKSEATVKALSGDISIEERGVDNDRYLTASFAPKVGGVYVEIPIILDGESTESMDRHQLKEELVEGTFYQRVSKVSRGMNYTKLKELELGEYLLTKIEENPPHREYGRSWCLTVEGVGVAISSGRKLERRLASDGKALAAAATAGKPLTLAIGKKTPTPQGVQVDAGIFTRAPKANKVPKLKSASPSRAKLKSATPETQAEQTTIAVKAETVSTSSRKKQAKKQESALVGAIVGPDDDYEDIPY